MDPGTTQNSVDVVKASAPQTRRTVVREEVEMDDVTRNEDRKQTNLLLYSFRFLMRNTPEAQSVEKSKK